LSSAQDSTSGRLTSGWLPIYHPKFLLRRHGRMSKKKAGPQFLRRRSRSTRFRQFYWTWPHSQSNGKGL